MAGTAKKIEVTLNHERDTKGTKVYSTEQDGVAARNIYITKAGAEKIGNPTKVKLTIEAAE